MGDILILGATGYTGKLIVKYLATHHQNVQFSLGVASRSVDDLSELVSLYFGSNIIKGHVVNPQSHKQLSLVIAQYTVVINTIGKSHKTGTTVVQSLKCAFNRMLAINMTNMCCHRFDRVPTTKPRSVIVTGCGFGSIPSDICVYESRKALQAEYGQDVVVRVSSTAHDLKTFSSQGSISSTLSMLDNTPINKLWRSTKSYSLSPSEFFLNYNAYAIC
ncbi:hypothetical protein BDQ12DRAFT_607063 [Crucibulum laeve]|uniref:Saccharopine dehydrogenase NADP binding domain-containing protein n=1 Tax=Crucibulum laeve TaxID=68775 RepID=A0A5C3LYG9_9AGAR|nr:hypothetical protein BDQ12DRAFT_607063 [Crucibulum laeve]